jgi:hypothetical protein
LFHHLVMAAQTHLQAGKGEAVFGVLQLLRLIGHPMVLVVLACIIGVIVCVVMIARKM